MNFVAQVEDHLRDLGAEARKNHPGVKEASERAIIHLRSLQTQYVAAVRRASAKNQQHPTTALFQSQDVLRPFLLAANYSNASYELLVIALESMQLLLTGDAICPEDGVQIARVLVIQSWGCAGTLGLGSSSDKHALPNSSGGVGGMIHAASSSVSSTLGGITGMVLGGGGSGGGHSSSSTDSHGHYQSHRSMKEDESISLKILQTITMLVDSKSVTSLTQDVLGACLSICLSLGAGQAYTTDHHGSSGKGPSIRERFTQSTSVDTAKHDGGGSGTYTTGGTAGNIKRAALATMNQILSILFERAKDVEITTSNSDDESILLLAEQTFTDLCTLVQRQNGASSSSTQSTQSLIGPFAVASKEGLVPSPTTSLALVDMIMKQICGDLFHVCFRIHSRPTWEEEQQQTGVTFATKIITQSFELGQALLGSQYCYHVTKLSLESSLKEVPNSLSPANVMDFCLYYYTTSLATTILTNYLSSQSVTFYESFDIHVANAGDEKYGGVAVRKMALDMIKQLVSFVSEATEAYHKSDDFEDGYIFTQSERVSFDMVKTNDGSSSTRGPSTQQGGRQSPQQQLPVSSISNEKLWRAFLALEVLSQLVSSHLEQMSWVDANSVAVIAVAASDFATISASNRERILLLLMTAHAADDQSLPLKSHATFKSAAVDVHDKSDKEKSPTLDCENSNIAVAVAAKVTDALVVDSVELPLCDAGATTWLAFKCILFLVKSLKDLATSAEANGSSESIKSLSELVNGSFAPSVSMLQHFIRRMLGSPIIVSLTLSSYEELASASMMVDSPSTNERRQAILTSLCKLCLPSWGKRRPNCQLKESNIDSLWTMLWIIHLNFEKISDEWDIILSTLDQLAIIQIASSKLPESYTEKVTTIAGCFIRLPSFTTCFTSDALLKFICSLIKLSEVVSFKALMEQQTHDIARENSENSYGVDSPEKTLPPDREPSMGGRLLGFAGRAFGGGGAATHSSTATIPNKPSFRRVTSATGGDTHSKTYAEDLKETTCLQLTKMKISTPHNIIRNIPLPLLLITVVAEANSYRLTVIEEAVAKHLCEIVARSSSVELRSFAMEVLIHFMPLSLSKSKDNMFIKYGSGPLMVPNREDMNELPLEVHPIQDSSDAKVDNIVPSEPQLLKILCQTIERSTQVDTAENCLNALLVVLEGAGHSLSGENLIIVINTLSTLSGCESEEEEDNGNDNVVNRSNKKWVTVSSLAFQNLKLILDEFLEQPTSASSEDSPLKSVEARDAILDCCVAFGRSRHDVNTSLTATGMLWSLADRDSSPDTLHVVLSKLAYLAMDDRTEVRNCSVNTLFSCIVGLGDQFTDKQWKTCLVDTIFGILNGIASAIHQAGEKESRVNGGSNEERYKVAVHHSRNSAKKQWATSQILVLRGLERVLRTFFTRLLEILLSSSSNDDLWFLQTWKDILQVSFDCAIISGERETLDMRLTGVELIVLCAQLSSKAGIVAAGNSARVGTNMEVVGGALRTVRAAPVEDKAREVEKRVSKTNQEEADKWRKDLFGLSFNKLIDLRVFLEDNGKTENEGSKNPMVIDSLLTQVLTKLTGELMKLYECCKNDEMLPGPCELKLDISVENDNGYESRFLHLLLVIADNAGNDKNSRFLNQVQRGIMALLQSMAANSSLRAFQTLAAISGDHMFVRPKALSSSGKDCNFSDDEAGEIFELEAAKMVASAFDSDDLSDEAKVAVMCSVLLQYLRIYGGSDVANGNDGDKRKTSEARYDIITSVINSGLDAAVHIDSKTHDKTILDSIWDRVIATMSSLLLPADNRYDGYAHHSKSILNIVAIVLSHLPTRKLSMAEPMLENGANRAVEVAFECNEKNNNDADNTNDTPYSQAAEGAIHVFLACFMGLCQKMPTCPAVNSLTNRILGETIESDNDELSEKTELQSKTRHSLAIAVCESLRTTTSQDLLVGLFPLLCRLTNVENDGLQRAAGTILGSMNLSEAISRERHRADQADIRAKEIEEENVAMLEEIEYLQAENEELQRQLAVFSESSDYV